MKTRTSLLWAGMSLWMGLSSAVAQTYTRTEQITYHDNLSKWVLGQQATLTVNGTLASQTTYNANAQPTVLASFGKTVQTLTYNTDGTVATVKDGNNRTTTLSSWKRGIPQLIQHADSTSQSAVVNDAGWITRVTDENGFQTNYTYDGMGRLASIVYPTGDATAWNTTTQVFAQIASAEYGIPAGHWRQTVATGNGRKITYFDALWRPLVTREYDTANETGTRRFQRFTYDHDGRVTFASYPATVHNPTTGTWSEYDALGRPTSVSQDSEHGLLTTTTQYLTGFQTRVTSPKGQQTTTSYLAWDQPTTDYPVMIAHPAGAWTHISRDGFGKPTQLRRSNSSSSTGGSVALNRTYAYNAHQELCRSVEPETGATLMGYDGAGNLTWSASGLPAGTACHATGNTGTINPHKATRTYNNRNRLTALSFADGRGNQTWTYTPDGLPATIATNNTSGGSTITNTYTYNKRRLPTGETIGVGGQLWSVGYGYTVNGHLAGHVYPDGLNVSYVPNALGQWTQAGTFATGVSYFPNGAIKQFTYGNGIVHTLTQNARGLPDRSRDAYGASAVHDDSMDYDGHGNVAAVSDGLPGGRGHRDMSYDGLDRLTSTVSPMFGTATYSYDVLDNLKTVKLTAGSKVRDHGYVYDASHRLTNVTNTSGGATVVGLGYDARGNLGNKSGQLYDFDLGNRLREVTGVEQYHYDGHGRRVRAIRDGQDLYSIYGQDGVLRFQRDERTGKSTSYVQLGSSLVAQVESAIPLSTPTLTLPGSSATGSYAISWTLSPLASKYQLQERLGAGSWSTVHDGAGVSKAISGKSAGVWGYQVRACSATACGNWSLVQTVTVQLPPSVAPTLSVPGNGLNGAFTVGWSQVAAADRFQLQERLGTGSWSTVHDGPGTSKAVSGKAAGSWGYRVRGCNAVGCGTWSAVGTVVVILKPASTPTLTVPATNTTGGYSVDWNGVATSTRYELEERLGTAGWSQIHNASATSKALTGRAAGSWGYRVRACNDAGCSGFSPAATVAVTRAPATAPTLTVPSSNIGGSYAVIWTGVAQATKYQLQERLGSGSWTTIHDAAGGSLSISGKVSGTWSYRVNGCNQVGCSGWSAIGSVEVTTLPAGPPAFSSIKNQHYIGQLVHIQCFVNWNAVATATSYELKVYGGGLQYAGPGTSVSGSYNTATYCAPSHQMRACNAAGCSSWSGPVVQQLREFGTPSEPGDPNNPEVPRAAPGLPMTGGLNEGGDL